ncbi:MAG: T9SS type A sorting domain-containing protein [Muribaculaceae bacterium]|nr:T9SS type A sorting domain-containing protein [Muribaculaceae bacterium]
MRKIYILPILLAGLTMHSMETATLPSSTSDGIVAGHGYVDLGLPSGTLWATTNIGAENPYESGQYFAWGETEPREIFNWHNYKYLEKESIGENGNIVYTVANIGDNISGSQYDAARIQWGDAWRMPTQEECEELIACCSSEFITQDDTVGLCINGPNDNSLFLPISLCPGNGIGPSVLTGNYWSATASSDHSNMAVSLYFANSNIQCINDVRCTGLTIRPVISHQDMGTSVASLTDSTLALKYEDGTVTVSGHSEKCLLTVTDLSGRCIRTIIVTDGKYHLTDLPKGIYILSLQKGCHTLGTIKIGVK